MNTYESDAKLVAAQSKSVGVDLFSIDFSEMVTYWLGGSRNAAIVLAKALTVLPHDKFMPYTIVEEQIRNHLSNDREFFNEAVYGGTCDEDFDYILRCIHENEQNLLEEEWQEEYSEWTHLTTVEQVADEYYGYDELISLMPQWYCDPVTEILLENYREALRNAKASIQTQPQ